jgi:hypothetical protein
VLEAYRALEDDIMASAQGDKLGKLSDLLRRPGAL